MIINDELSYLLSLRLSWQMEQKNNRFGLLWRAADRIKELDRQIEHLKESRNER